MSAKRKRDEDETLMIEDYWDSQSGKELMRSAAAMLSVPISLLFRQVETLGQWNPLLSRSEAQTFLHINMLSEELDILTDTTQNMLQGQNSPLLIALQTRDHPYLRPLQVLLESIDIIRPMNEVSNRLKVIVKELSTCCKVLSHSAEQNWSMAHLLRSATIGAEKQMLSKIEDELCRRIQLLCSFPSLKKKDASDKRPITVSMEEYCQQLLNGTNDEKEEKHTIQQPSTPPPVAASIGHSNANGTSPSLQHGTPDTIAGAKQPETQQKCPPQTAVPFPSVTRGEISQPTKVLGTTDTHRGGLHSIEPKSNQGHSREEETTLTLETALLKKPLPSIPQHVDTAAQHPGQEEKKERRSNESSLANNPDDVAEAATLAKLAMSSAQVPEAVTSPKDPITQQLSIQEDSDDDELLEDMVQQESARKLLQTDRETMSQELTSPAASPKHDNVEKENEPSQSSTQSSIPDDAAFRSQHAVEVLFSIRGSRKAS